MWKTRWERIEEVEVDRASESSVWINGRRNSIRSSWEAYHETWEAAHAYIMGIAETGLLKAQRDLDRARSKLETVKAMKPNTSVCGSPPGASTQDSFVGGTIGGKP